MKPPFVVVIALLLVANIVDVLFQVVAVFSTSGAEKLLLGNAGIALVAFIALVAVLFKRRWGLILFALAGLAQAIFSFNYREELYGEGMVRNFWWLFLLVPLSLLAFSLFGNKGKRPWDGLR